MVPNSDKDTTASVEKCAYCHKLNHTMKECHKLMATSLKWQEEKEKDKHKSSSNSANKASSKPKPVVQKAKVMYTNDSDNDSEEVNNFYSTTSYMKFITTQRSEMPQGRIYKKYDAIIDGGCSEFGSSTNAIELVQCIETTNKTYEIHTNNGIKMVYNAREGKSKCFGPLLFDEKEELTVLSLSRVESMWPVKVIKQGNHTISYHVLITPYKLVLKFDRNEDGIFLCNLGRLLNKPFIDPVIDKLIMFKSVNRSAAPSSDDDDDQEEFRSDDIKEIKDAIKTLDKQVPSTKTRLKEAEYALKVLQPAVGYISSADFEKQVNNGTIINAPVPANAIRKAVELVGHSDTYMKGKGKTQRNKSHLKEQLQSLTPGQVIVEMDLAFVEELVFLFAVCVPGYYSSISYIGYGKGKGSRSSEHLLQHLLYIFSVYKALKLNIKFVSADGEKGFGALVIDIQNAAEATYVPLEKGSHLSFVDNRIKVWKEKIRCMINQTSTMLPRKLLIGAALNAIFFMNSLSCSANINDQPPQFLLTGMRLDIAKLTIKFGDLCEVSAEDSVINGMKPRTITAIALYPTHNGGYVFYNIVSKHIIKRKVWTRVNMTKGILELLHQLRVEQLDKLHLKPNETILSAVQHKKVVDFKTLYFPYHIEKHGPERVAIAGSTELTGMVEKHEAFRGVHFKDIPNEYRSEILRSRMMFTEKVKENTAELKARFIMIGNKKKKSNFDHSEDINSPTIAFYTLCQLLATAAKEGLDITTIDFVQAFLHAKQDKPQYAKVDKYVTAMLVSLYPEKFLEYVQSDGSMYIELLKAIYGQVQAARLFNKHLVDQLNKMGFDLNSIDRGLFMKIQDDGLKAEAASHVDDIIIQTPSKITIDTINQFKSHFGDDIKIQSTVHQSEIEFLGWIISINKEEKYVSISPRKFYTKLCTKFAILINGKVKKYPAGLDLFVVDQDSPKLSLEEHDIIANAIFMIRYACMVAAETLCAASFLVSRIKEGLTVQDKQKLIHLLQYINGRIDMPLKLGPNSEGNYHFIVYSDASYGAGDGKHDGKSVLAGVTTLGRGAIWSTSNKNSGVDRSSTQAELSAASDVIAHASHQQQILISRGLSEGIRPGIFNEDNKSTIQLIKNGRSLNAKTKHINIRYFFTKQFFDNGDFELVHCPTDLMLADILTKPLQGELFFRLRALLLGHKCVE